MLFAPNLFGYYATQLGALFDSDSSLVRVFKGVWPAITFNFGPFTICFPHIDTANLAWGWCSICALGNYDPKCGGHLVLWDLGLIVEFPPGSTTLIPSAIVKHSNTRISPNETRYSFTLYAAAGLFRWVYNGFCSDKDWIKKASRAQKAERERHRQKRWEEGLAMFPKLYDLTRTGDFDV
jgi:hypothetical protein